MHYTHEHREIQNTLKRFIEAEINPHVDGWDAPEIFLHMRSSRGWATWACWA
jgi:hypothetical protein